MRLSERALKDQLYDLAEADFALPEQADPLARALEMLPHLGSPDSELRDDLIYTALSHWLLAGRFDEAQLKTLLNTLLDEAHLFYQIGAEADDSVFMRSFSMLLLPLLIANHRQRPFLMRSEIKELKRKTLDYLARERDLRDFVFEDDKGWAFAVAHTADCLDELAQCAELEAADLVEILEAVRAKTAVSHHVYQYEEDERLVYPVLAALARKVLREVDVREWLEGFKPLAQAEEPFPDCYIQAMNVKHFLRSLYFRAKQQETAARIGEGSAAALAGLTESVLQDISRF